MAEWESHGEVHEPVMVREVLEYLACRPGGVFVDATLGSGGHTAAILEAVRPGGRVIGIDRDPEAVARAQSRFAGQPVAVVHSNYARLRELLDNLGIAEVDGVLIDAGASLEQLTTGRRGFSLREEGLLDMRMDPSEDRPTAADLVNELPEEELSDLLWQYGEERRARAIARSIVTARQQHRITTTAELAAIVTATIPPRARPARLHAATKTFMALRIAVNDELGALHTALEAAIDRTRSGGRIVVLTYHSLEGGETKDVFRQASVAARPGSPFPSGETPPRVKRLTKHAVKPTAEEVRANPRARSALLRVAEKL